MIYLVHKQTTITDNQLFRISCCLLLSVHCTSGIVWIDSTKLSRNTSHIASFTGKETRGYTQRRGRVQCYHETIHDLNLKNRFSPDKHSAFENANFSRTVSCWSIWSLRIKLPRSSFVFPLEKKIFVFYKKLQKVWMCK